MTELYLHLNLIHTQTEDRLKACIGPVHHSVTYMVMLTLITLGPNGKLTLFTFRRRKKAETNHNKDHLQTEETESQKLIENPKQFERSGSISSKKSLNSIKMTEGEENQVSFKDFVKAILN